jgi:GNAT superfamily N-acetyltransferase
MAHRGDVQVGRICVGINQSYNEKKNQHEGYICLFESINDREVAFALFDKAVEWLRARGINMVKGPVSPTNGDDSRGLLVMGFDGAPVLMNSYNPEYYLTLFNDFGFVKHLDLFAYYFDVDNGDIERFSRPVEFAMKRYNFQVDRIDLKNIDNEMKDVKKILDIAMPEDWEDLTPPTLEEIRAEGKTIVAMADPDLIYIARSEGNPIGFGIALPDYNQVLKRMNGRLFPFGFLKFLKYKKKIDGGRIFILFVIPEFRKKAVSSAILYNCLAAGKRKGYKYGEGSTIGEINVSMRRDAEGAGGIHYRTYRLFKKNI